MCLLAWPLSFSYNLNNPNSPNSSNDPSNLDLSAIMVISHIDIWKHGIVFIIRLYVIYCFHAILAYLDVVFSHSSGFISIFNSNNFVSTAIMLCYITISVIASSIIYHQWFPRVSSAVSPGFPGFPQRFPRVSAAVPLASSVVSLGFLSFPRFPQRFPGVSYLLHCRNLAQTKTYAQFVPDGLCRLTALRGECKQFLRIFAVYILILFVLSDCFLNILCPLPNASACSASRCLNTTCITSPTTLPTAPYLPPPESQGLGVASTVGIAVGGLFAAAISVS